MIRYDTYTHYLAPGDKGWTKDKYQQAFEQLRKDALLLAALIDIREERVRWGNNRLIKNGTLIRLLGDFAKANPNEGLIVDWAPEIKSLVCAYDSRKKKRYASNIEVLSRKMLFGLGGFVFNDPDPSITNRCLPRKVYAEVRKKGVAIYKK